MNKPDSGTPIASEPRMRWFGISIGALVCASTYLLVGCVGELKELLPPEDMSTVVIEPDMTMMGGDEMGPSGPKFFPDIQNDLQMKSCGVASSCHATGGNMPILITNPPPTAQADLDANYMSFKAVSIDTTTAAAPDDATVLKALLPGGGHAGGPQLPSMSDPIYMRWRTWIANGGPR